MPNADYACPRCHDNGTVYTGDYTCMTADRCPECNGTPPCKSCGAPTDPLDFFPGHICLECYKKTPEANAPLTSDDIVRTWGGRTQNDRSEDENG